MESAGRSSPRGSHTSVASLMRAQGNSWKGFGAPKSEQAHALPVMEIGPECRIKAIYRARRADGRKAAEQIMTDPRALERPPKELAIPGRMNAGGIPVFYGAIAEKVALAEVRPSVGSFVITGKFSVRRRLRV